MIEAFKTFVSQQHLFSPQDSVLLAVSGGIDSVVMADLFAQANYCFAIAHVNFRLRGEASEADEAFVRTLADQYGVPCYVQAFDTQAESQQSGSSVQMTARSLRYDWLQLLAKERKFACVATAHQKNDVFETLLFNLTKGTGIAGLHGIPVKTRLLIRPLLFATRTDIAQYARQRPLSWREDASNLSVKYARNRIRLEVMPALLKINPNLLHTLDDTLERMQGAEKVLQHYVKQIKAESLQKIGQDIFISLTALQKAEALPVVLAELLKPYDFPYAQVKTIAGFIQNASSATGKRFTSARYVLNIDRTHLIISPAEASGRYAAYLEKDTHQLTLDDHRRLVCQVAEASTYKLPADPAIAALDLEKLTFPLQIRSWQEGDRFYPLGMQGKKKLSDFMIDRKIPLNLKDRILVLLSSDAIAWVVGHRIDERFKITKATKQVFQIIQQDIP